MQIPMRIVAALPLLILLSACGGGGGGGSSDTTAVVQNTPVLTGLSVTPVDSTIESGSNIQLTATGTFSDKSTSDLTDQVSWSSSASGVATVGATGLVIASGVGSATILAVDGSGLSASTNLAVQGFTIQGTIPIRLILPMILRLKPRPCAIRQRSVAMSTSPAQVKPVVLSWREIVLTFSVSPCWQDSQWPST